MGHQKYLVCAALWLVTFGIGSEMLAQNNESRQASLCFDVDLQQLRGTSLFKDTALEALLIDDWYLGDEDFSVADILQIEGAVAFPDDFQKIVNLQFGKALPLDFYIRMEISSREKCDTYYEMMKWSTEEKTEGGVTFIVAPDATNLIILRTGNRRVEIGTKSFLLRADRDVRSAALKALVAEQPSSPCRVAFSSTGIGSFVDSVRQFFGDQFGGEVGEAVMLLDKVKHLTFEIDPHHPAAMARLHVRTEDARAGGEIRVALNKVLKIGQQAFAEIPFEVEAERRDLLVVVRNAINSLKAGGVDDNVEVVLPQPTGYRKAIKILKFIARTRKPKRPRPTRKMNEVRQLLLAMLNYESAHQKFPFELIDVENPLSWRAKILPYLEENELYDALDLTKGWDAPVNLAAAKKMPRMFGKDQESDLTPYVFVRPDGAPQTFRDIRDGSSNTIAILEFPEGVAWLQSNGKTPDEVVAMFDDLPAGQTVIAGFYDGAVTLIASDIDRHTLRCLLDPDDGNVVDFDR